jgi:tetratricopeptide (TPR) repeat protein
MRCSICFRRVLAGGACPEHPHLMVDAGAPTQADRVPEIAGLWIGETLGRGGFAVVYRARRHGAAVDLALKVAHRRGDERIEHEARILQRLGSPLAPALAAMGQTTDGRTYLLMELAGSDSLARRLATAAQVTCTDLETAVQQFAALCQAVETMHRAGIVHRDLKPENVMFRPDGQVTLIDFGLARRQDEHDDPGAGGLTRTGERLGTYEYMAPEQWRDARAHDRRVDIYALGVLLFEMLTGRPPFVGDEATVRHGHVSGRCPPPSTFTPLAGALDAVTLRCLAKDPAQRPASAVEVAELVRQAMDQRRQAMQAAPASPASVPAGLVEHRPVAMVGVCTAAAATLVGSMAAAAGGVLARVAGGCHVIAFPWALSIAAGVRAAGELGTALARAPDSRGAALVHLAPLRLRRTPRGVRLFGPALAECAAGAAQVGPGTGVSLSPAAAGAVATTPGEATPEGTSDGLVRPAPGTAPSAAQIDVDPAEVAMRGRDALLDALVAEARRCCDRQQPVLVTVSGEPGAGKTRFLHALAQVLQAQVSGHVRCVRSRDPGDPDGVSRELLRLALDLPDGPVTLAGLDRAWSALNAHPHQAGRWAVALLLGAVSESEPAVALILRAPGALRQAASYALALALVARARAGTLMLLVDDTHRADPIALDAIEHATLSGNVASLAIYVAARPEFHDARPHWGVRASSASRYTLPPLDQAGAHALLRDLLRPVEYVPEPVLDRLYALAGGVPLYLVELARAVRRSGAIRPHPGAQGYFIAADELLRDTASGPPVEERLARTALGSVPSSLLPLVELCAVLGDDFDVTDLAGAQAVFLELHGPDPVGDVDAAVGLSRLVQLGLVRPGGSSHAVAPPLLRRAIEALIRPSRSRALHQAVLRHGQQRGDWSLARQVHHTACAGMGCDAARLHLQLAGDAHRRHRYVEAERDYTLALEHAGGDAALRQRALAGRGSVRYRLQRLREAVTDLRQARALAEARGSDEDVAALLLEESTVLDWCDEPARSAEVAVLAVPLVERVATPVLCAGLALALGRTHYRKEEFDLALAQLGHAVDLATGADLYEIRVQALLLLAPSLVYAGRHAEAGQRFDETMALCREAGDDFHLAVVHLNRQILWARLGDAARLIADLETCSELARRLGNGQLERGALGNLAQALLWSGSLDRALLLAERARALQLQFLHDHAPYEDALLLARILCARGEPATRDYVQWLEQHCDVEQLPPSVQALLRFVRLVLDALDGRPSGHAVWQAVARDAAQGALVDHQIEVLATAAEILARHGSVDDARRCLDEALELSRREPTISAARLAALEQRLAT